MCQCTPESKTPFCGKPGCEWPPQLKPPTIRRLRIVGGPTLHKVRIFDAESGIEIHVRSFQIVADWPARILQATITLPAEVDLSIGLTVDNRMEMEKE